MSDHTQEKRKQSEPPHADADVDQQADDDRRDDAPDAETAATDGPDESREARPAAGGDGDGETSHPHRPPLRQMMQTAKEEMELLLGRPPEAMSGMKRTDEGWLLSVDVLEFERVPSSMDVLATYEVLLDGGGQVIGYERVRKFIRSESPMTEQ